MAKNDTVVIDSIIKQRTGPTDLTSVERGEEFQRLAIEQVLKHRTPDPEELEEGIVDGSDDGERGERWTPIVGQVGSYFKVVSAVHHMLPD